MSITGPGDPVSRSLGELLPELAGSASGQLRVSGVCQDSRSARPGYVFIALRGARHDGAHFVPEAARRGAHVALVERGSEPVRPIEGIEVVGVDRLGERVGDIAARFFGDPSASMALIGVTGTNGKTTCTQLLAQAFGLLGVRCGVIGTIGWGFPGELEPTAHTTPDAVSIQHMLGQLRRRGATVVAMEVSSHALSQGRTRAVHFASAIFTNLTHDHLDYHGTLEEYGASKQLLFAGRSPFNAVINIDDPFGRQLLAALGPEATPLSYGIGERNAMVRAAEPEFSGDGLSAEVVTPWGRGVLVTPLLGRFNLGNALAVLSALCLHGIVFDEALGVLARLSPVQGRMERVAAPSGPLVIVDYAHTPDALEQTLRALRHHCTGRLWCVFGCGGDRDRAKRPLMGRIAWEHADEPVITSDNPRSESPGAIIDEIATGIPDPDVVREPDRAAAIRRAILGARPGDCVLIAGKGHENYQETNGQRLPFSDVEIAREVLALWSAAT